MGVGVMSRRSKLNGFTHRVCNLKAIGVSSYLDCCAMLQSLQGLLLFNSSRKKKAKVVGKRCHTITIMNTDSVTLMKLKL